MRSVISSASGRRVSGEANRRELGPEPHEGRDELGVGEVGPDGVRDARVLHLDHDLAPAVQVGGVHLPDRRGRHRALAEPLEHLVDGSAELPLDDRGHRLVGHRRRIRLQRADDLLVGGAVLLGDGTGVEERHELADLHGHALHVPEHGDVPLGLSGEPVELLLLVPRQLPGDPPRRLPDGQSGEWERPLQPPGPDPVVVHHIRRYGPAIRPTKVDYQPPRSVVVGTPTEPSRSDGMG